MRKIKVTFYPSKTKAVALTCEVAKSIGEKMKGLMHRSTLPEDKGMIFLFWFPWFRIFWMKNVNISLDIIFVRRDLTILNICKAEVNSGLLQKIYWSRGLCKYVVETNKGFCKKHNIVPGTKLEIEKIKKESGAG
jgi:uncharacterized membrane protein (UPF0127 family)